MVRASSRLEILAHGLGGRRRRVRDEPRHHSGGHREVDGWFEPRDGHDDVGFECVHANPDEASGTQHVFDAAPIGQREGAWLILFGWGWSVQVTERDGHGNAHPCVFGRSAPAGEDQTATVRDRTSDIAECFDRAIEKHDPEARNDPIGRRGEPVRRGIGLQERDLTAARESRCGATQHRRRHVNPDDVPAVANEVGQGEGRTAAAAADVDDLLAGSNVGAGEHRVTEWFERAIEDLLMGGPAFGRRTVPVFDLCEIHRHRSPGAARG